jgi:hypothetical protein
LIWTWERPSPPSTSSPLSIAPSANPNPSINDGTRQEVEDQFNLPWLAHCHKEGNKTKATPAALYNIHHHAFVIDDRVSRLLVDVDKFGVCCPNHDNKIFDIDISHTYHYSTVCRTIIPTRK